MDVVLGVAVEDRIARLALVASAAQGHDVIDQSDVELGDNPIGKLTETVVGTDRLLAEENHRLLATRLCWSDPQRVDELRQALENSGVQNVVVLSEQDAATALLETAATGLAPSGTSDDPTRALARGAAMAVEAAGFAGEATAMAPALGSEWAYSAVDPEPEDDAEAQTGPLRGLGAMDVVLGVAVAGSIARLAFVAPAAGGYAAIRHSVIDLAVDPFQTLIRAVGDAQHLLAGENRRLVATRVYSPDPAQAQALSQALAGSGVGNVALISEADAVTALLHSGLGAGAPAGSVLLQVTAEAATLFGLGAGAAGAVATVLAAVALQGVGDAAAAAVDMLLAFVGTAPFEVAAAYVTGTFADLAAVVDQLRARSPLRAELLDAPEFAIASGAAAFLAAPAVGLAGDATAMAPAVGLAGDATAMAPAADATQLAGEATGIAPTAGLADAHAEEPQLAYSMSDDGEPLAVEDEFGDEPYDDEDAPTTARRLSGRSLLISNAVVAFAIIGFASLAVAVAITVRPTAAASPVVGRQNAAPGKFMPLLPTQQQAPVPAPPPDQPNAGYQGGIIPDSNGYIPPQLVSGGGESPGGPAPGLMPNPNGPIPIPIIVPYPGWRPPYPPYRPPYPSVTTTTVTTTTTTPVTTTTTPVTTTTTPVTTTTTPVTTTTTPVTTTTTPVTTTTTPPVTTTTPVTTTQPPVTTTPPTSSKAPYTSQAPQTSVAPPHVQTQQTVAPKPVTPQPATPQPVTPHPPTGHH